MKVSRTLYDKLPHVTVYFTPEEAEVLKIHLPSDQGRYSIAPKHVNGTPWLTLYPVLEGPRLRRSTSAQYAITQSAAQAHREERIHKGLCWNAIAPAGYEYRKDGDTLKLFIEMDWAKLPAYKPYSFRPKKREHSGDRSNITVEKLEQLPLIGEAVTPTIKTQRLDQSGASPTVTIYPPGNYGRVEQLVNELNAEKDALGANIEFFIEGGYLCAQAIVTFGKRK